MSDMAGLEDRKPYTVNLLIILLVFVYLAYAVLTSNNYDAIRVSLEHDFANMIYQNEDTTVLYLYYFDDGLEQSVVVYLILITLTSLLLMVSFLMRRTLSSFLLLCNYIINFSLMVYPYFYLRLTSDSMFLTSFHFLLLTSYVNDYSLYIFIPYYSVLIGLTLYFIVGQYPFNPLRVRKY
ncbi:hypothetical protein D3C76_1242290 [compost metagenome]